MTMRALWTIAIGLAWAPSTQAQASEAPCLANFTIEGGHAAGRTFKSFQEYGTLDQAKAFQRVAQQIAADGWQGMNAQKDLGVITASQSTGKGAQLPLNVVIRPMGAQGARIDVVFSTTGRVNVSAKDVQDAFCKILGAAPG